MEAIKKARFLATQARDDAPHYQHSEIGYNYRMSNVLAGIGRGQMEVLESRILKRREINRFYKDLFNNIDGIEFSNEPNTKFYSNFWLTTIQIDKTKTSFDREELWQTFKKENIESRPLWKPMHLQPVFIEFPKYINGVSEGLFIKGLCLPSGSNLTDYELDRIKNAITKVLSL